GRVAASLLNAVGLAELITISREHYETLAHKIATDATRHAALKARLAENRTKAPLFDTTRYARSLEAAYRTMWERQQRSEAPVILGGGGGWGSGAPGGGARRSSSRRRRNRRRSGRCIRSCKSCDRPCRCISRDN